MHQCHTIIVVLKTTYIEKVKASQSNATTKAKTIVSPQKIITPSKIRVLVPKWSIVKNDYNLKMHIHKFMPTYHCCL